MHINTWFRTVLIVGPRKKKAWPPAYFDCPSAAPCLARKPSWQPAHWNQAVLRADSKHLQRENL